MNIYEVKDGCPLKGKTEQMTEEELQKGSTSSVGVTR